MITAPDRLGDQQIHVLAVQLARFPCYHVGNVAPDDMRMVFLPLLGTPPELLETHTPFAVVGIHATTGMAYNGMPTFVEMRLIHYDDMQRAHDTALAMQEAIRNVPVAPSREET